MLIVLSHLPADGLKFEHQYEANELDLSNHDFTFATLPLIKGRVNKVGVEMRLKGTIKAALEINCDRCLELFTLPIEKEFDLFYLPATFLTDQSGEKELLERDLDASFYLDDKIDGDEMVLEQLELSLPSRVLCQEDCRGLCAECGANLNEAQCDCQPPIDPRWQALADLKK